VYDFIDSLQFETNEYHGISLSFFLKCLVLADGQLSGDLSNGWCLSFPCLKIREKMSSTAAGGLAVSPIMQHLSERPGLLSLDKGGQQLRGLYTAGMVGVQFQHIINIPRAQTSKGL